MSIGIPANHPAHQYEQVIPKMFSLSVPKMAPLDYRASIEPNIEIRAERNASYNPSTDRFIRFLLIRGTMLDLRKMCLKFNLTIDQPTAPGDEAWLENPGCINLIKTIRVLNPGVPIEDQQVYNRITGWQHEILSPVGSFKQAELWGMGTLAQRKTWGATVDKLYHCPLQVHSLMRQPLPTMLIRDQLILEIELAPVEEAITADSAAGVDYAINNPVLFCHQITSERLTLLMDNKLRDSGIDYSMQNWHYTKQGPIVGTQAIVKLTNRSMAIEHILIIFQPVNYVNDVTQTGKFIDFFKSNFLNYTLISQGKRWPQQPQAFNDSYFQLLKHYGLIDASGVWGNQTFALGQTDFETGNRFFVIIPINQVGREDGLVSNEGFYGWTADTEIELNFNPAPAVDTDMHIFVLRQQTARVTQHGNMLKIND